MTILRDILKTTPVISVVGNVDVSIADITIDSRKAYKNNLFIAIDGYNTDGHLYIENAISKGCNTIVCQKLPKNSQRNITYVLVEDTRLATASIVHCFYGDPSSKLNLIGVTGTNGKTTTATLLYNIFTNLEYKVGLISTINNIIDKRIYPNNLTTPDIVSINKLLCDMVKNKCTYCFMEVSSHAIEQGRISKLNFTGAIFLNITHDHLDYHKTFKNYINAKKSFFDSLFPNAFALYNNDDKNARVMIQNCKAKAYSFSLKSPASFNTKIISQNLDYMHLSIDTGAAGVNLLESKFPDTINNETGAAGANLLESKFPDTINNETITDFKSEQCNEEVYTKLIGDFNAYNILASYACSILLKQNFKDVLKILSLTSAPKGRLEIFKTPKGVYAIIDYAHTPDAVEKVLKTINQIKKKNSSIITIIGCGGDRDKEKRPLIGKIAVNLSNYTIFTSDNPRNENPADIILDMHKKIDSKVDKINTIIDRKEAINHAYSLTKNDDIIVILGKGHESYQEINLQKFYFNDLDVIKEVCL